MNPKKLNFSCLTLDPRLADAPNWLKLENEGGALLWEGVLVWTPIGVILMVPGEKFVSAEIELRITYGFLSKFSNSAHLELYKFLSLSTCAKKENGKLVEHIRLYRSRISIFVNSAVSCGNFYNTVTRK